MCSGMASQNSGCFATDRVSLYPIQLGIQHRKLPQDRKERRKTLTLLSENSGEC